MGRFWVRTVNGILTLVLAVTLGGWGAYSAYVLWDNRQVYVQAQALRQGLLEMKPAEGAADPGPAGAPKGAAEPDFEGLLAVNPDVCGWVEMEGTAIDHPVLQGEHNLSYINTDARGNFALAGSIFLDSRNDKGFGDQVSLLYGHNMADHGMFADLNLYKDSDFFRAHTQGALITPGGAYRLRILAVLVLDAADPVYFEPQDWNGALEAFLAYTRQKALHLAREPMVGLEGALEAEPAGEVRLLVLSTCSQEFSGARTLVLAWMEPMESKT